MWLWVLSVSILLTTGSVVLSYLGSIPPPYLVQQVRDGYTDIQVLTLEVEPGEIVRKSLVVRKGNCVSRVFQKEILSHEAVNFVKTRERRVTHTSTTLEVGPDFESHLVQEDLAKCPSFRRSGDYSIEFVAEYAMGEELTYYKYKDLFSTPEAALWYGFDHGLFLGKSDLDLLQRARTSYHWFLASLGCLGLFVYTFVTV